MIGKCESCGIENVLHELKFRNIIPKKMVCNKCYWEEMGPAVDLMCIEWELEAQRKKMKKMGIEGE